MDIIRSIIPASPFFYTDWDLLSTNVAESEYSAFNAATYYEAGSRVQVVSPSGTVSLTIASPCIMTWVNAQLPDNTIIRLTTTGALPTGLHTNKNYYVKRKSNSQYTLSLTRNGAPIVTSGSQSGTHTSTASRHDVYEAVLTSFDCTASISGTTLTVTAVNNGSVRIGMTITETAGGSAVAANTIVTAFLTGTGGTGTYKVSVSQTVTSRGINGTAPLTDLVSDSNPIGAWARADSTNPWRMHDNVVSSQTSNPDTIHNVYKLTSICDCAVLLDIDCKEVNIKMTDPADAVVYDVTVQATNIDGINDYYKYFFEPVIKKRQMLFTWLPKYPQAELELTITASEGRNALCGTFMIGQMFSVGKTQYGMQLGIQDYSVKKTDDFGNQTIVERNYSRKVSLISYIENSSVDLIHDQLSAYRAIPSVYIGSNHFGSSYVFGFYKQFNIEIAYTEVSLCSIDIEGLT